MEKIFANIQAQFEAFNKDAEAPIVKGNKAAGTRARKAALEICKLMKDFRKASVEAAKK
ncbi:MAG: histone H1 [Bacteroidales bacterium]|nr:histone H1 [Bacteroidales bacterium]